jgi:hypothetical protein
LASVHGFFSADGRGEGTISTAWTAAGGKNAALPMAADMTIRKIGRTGRIFGMAKPPSRDFSGNFASFSLTGRPLVKRVNSLFFIDFVMQNKTRNAARDRGIRIYDLDRHLDRVERRSASMVRTIVVYDSKHGSTELAAK